MNYRELRRALKSKLGAEEDPSGDHIFFFLAIGGREHRVGKLSHSSRGSEQVNDYVFDDTAKRLKLNKQELLQVEDCTMGTEEFLGLWEQRDP